MKENIIQQVIDSDSIEMLYGVLQSIPIQQIEEIITKVDNILKHQLINEAKIIHNNMQSYYTRDNVTIISKEFATIQKCLKRVLYNELPLHEKMFVFLLDFFQEYNPQEKIYESLVKLESVQKNMRIYIDVLTNNSHKFMKYVEKYHNWVSALTRFVPTICVTYGIEYENVSYGLSKKTIHASELLISNKQLEQSLGMQIQNQNIMINDILHITSISNVLLKNIVSTKQFFEKEYVGGIKIFKKYNK